MVGAEEAWDEGRRNGTGSHVRAFSFKGKRDKRGSPRSIGKGRTGCGAMGVR